MYINQQKSFNWNKELWKWLLVYSQTRNNQTRDVDFIFFFIFKNEKQNQLIDALILDNERLKKEKLMIGKIWAVKLYLINLWWKSVV